ncbi:Coatomer subunit epsilon-1 [Hibiscus syriacus]|uniref:Coatomer subunit epsilon-1 n=1 Tax=Hibiscus syriacus TaxID=106335 RepID=A0A6A3AA27_HIBSY|nr:Coatomer subunit epsilon-1 [Hibiscus syriacus]
MAGNPDHLFNLRNNFFLDAYQVAINNSDIPHLSTDDAVERDCLVYRSYIALEATNEIDSSASTPLQALNCSLSISPILETSLKEWLEDPAIGNNTILRLIAGIVFMHEEDYNEALKRTNAGGTMELWARQCLRHRTKYRVFFVKELMCYSSRKYVPSSESSERPYVPAIDYFNCLSEKLSNLHVYKQIGSSGTSDEVIVLSAFRHVLNVHIFKKMHRSEYAERHLMVMQQIDEDHTLTQLAIAWLNLAMQIDEDHTLTQLANAWLNLAMGGSKIQEAYMIVQDFSEKYPMTGSILKGKADAKDPETLAKLVVCNLHLDKSSSRYLSLIVGSSSKEVYGLISYFSAVAVLDLN